MIFPGTALSLRNSFFRRHDLGGRIGVGVASRCMTAAAALVAVTLPLSFAHAQTPPLNPTSPTVDCPNPVSQDLVMPPEIKSDKGVLKGTVILTQEFQRIATSTSGGAPTCMPQLVRAFRC